ncbi:glycosyltransferase family 4 protein [Microbacterium sp. OR16]|uniref:glycosyltransferase family 4 protein n=1 Tax=Microbacterium sp. OR16 TaxID=3095345 RepID=UPI0039B44B24
MSENLRVLLAVQPSVSHYRAPFVRALLAQTEIDFELVGRVNHSASATADPVAASDAVLEHVQELRRVPVLRALYWDRGLVGAVCRTSARAIVIEGNVYGLSNWVAIAIARIRRRRVVFWGHAWKRPESGVKLALRKFFYRCADAHLTYGNWAVAYAASVGLESNRFIPVYNSIYPGDVIAAQKVRDSRRTQSNTLRLMYSGRLTPRHCVDRLIVAVRALSAEGYGVHLDIVGDGPEATRLQELSNGSMCITFHGAVYDPYKLQKLYGDVEFAVSPGASGLNVIQALGFGVPVVAAEGDPQSGPELEAVRHRETGILYSASQGVNGLKRALVVASRTDSLTYRRLSENGIRVVKSRYSADIHARAVVAALVSMLDE